MPKLILSMDGLVLKEISLSKERTTIGRKPTNDIQIDNLSISGYHAAITLILGDAFLEDLNSTNGTYVNGQPVKKHLLQNNDVVDLGKYRLKYIEDNPQAEQAQRDTLLFTPQDKSDPVPEKESEPLATTQLLPTEVAKSLMNQGPGGRLGVVQLINGTQAGRELELNKPLTRLGKPGKQVAAISRRSNGYFMTHVEGEKPPTINGQPVPAHAQKLQEHDIIEIAGIKMEFFFRD